MDLARMDVCKFRDHGCDVGGAGHDDKKKIKHMTVVGDAVHQIKTGADKESSRETQLLSSFSTLRTTANGLSSRQVPQLVWKISSWRQKQMKAKLRLEPWVLSAPFYSFSDGYKLIAMVAPYGYNEGYGSALSIFVQIQPGEFDPLLEWPFNKTVTMTLYDQNESLLERRNYQYQVKTANTPSNTVFLKRPRRDVPNAPFGCELFCPISAVLDSTYIQNDEIIVGIHVSQ